METPASGALLGVRPRTTPKIITPDALLRLPPAVCIPHSRRAALRPTYAGAPPSLLTLGKFAEVELVFETAAADPSEAG
jgi:hypothetical protein